MERYPTDYHILGRVNLLSKSETGTLNVYEGLNGFIDQMVTDHALVVGQQD